MKTSIIVNFQLSAVDGVGEIVATAPEYWGDAVMLEDGNGYLNWKQYEDIGKADVTVWQGDDNDPLQVLVSQHWLSIDQPRPASVWTTVLRATTCQAQEYGMASYGTVVTTHAEWTLESAAAESGLSITQVYFGDDLKDLEGNPVSWNYRWHYEVEHRLDGLCESIWWPVLHRKPLDNAAIAESLSASISIYTQIEDPDDDYEIAFSAGYVDACEKILSLINQ